MMEDIVYIPPYTLWHKLKNGAIQEIKFEKKEDILQYKHSIFFVYLAMPEPNRDIRKDIPIGVVKVIDWNKVMKMWWENLNNANLPSRKDIEQKGIVELLIPLGVFKEEVDYNVSINDQPGKRLIPAEEYLYHPREEE